MSVVRVCFFGTPDFAARHLESLLKDEHYEVVAVVTQPDRPAGRKMQLTPSPVKVLAEKNGLLVLTPENLKKEPEYIEKLKELKAEIGVVVAFGQILSEDYLKIFEFGCVNVHGSLLPLWRGAAPIQRSIEAGDKTTGVSLQRMVLKLDAGPVIGERIVELNEEVNASELYDQLAELGSQLLEVEMMDYIRGNLAPRQQDESKVTVAKKIDKAEAQLDLSLSAEILHNKIRAFTMGPGTYVLFQGKRLKIHKTNIVHRASLGEPGRVSFVNHEELHVQVGKGILSLLEVQPESKAKMSITDFLKSHHLKKGDVFG